MKKYLFILLSAFYLFSCQEDEKNGKEVFENDVKDVVETEAVESDDVKNEEVPSNNQPSFNTPQGIITVGDLLIVMNPAFDMTSFTFGDGFITVIDSAKLEVLNIIKTTKKNPQYAAADSKNLYVVCTGETLWDMDTATVKPVSEGGIEVFPLTTLKTATSPEKVMVIPPGSANKLVGAPGRIVVSADEKSAYIGSTTSGVLFKVDLVEMKIVNNSDNPITIIDSDKNEWLNPYLFDQKTLAVLSFNNDELFFVDPSLKSPVLSVTNVGKSPDMEGAIDMVVLAGKTPDIYVLLSLSGSITAVSTKPSLSVETDFAITGAAPNRIVAKGDFLYIVNSLDNNLQRINLNTKKSDKPFTVFPVKSNPFDMAIKEGLAYVTLYLSNSVAVVKLENGEIIKEIK